MSHHEEPFLTGFDRIGKNWTDDQYAWRRGPSKQLLQIKPDYSMKIQKKCELKYGNVPDALIGKQKSAPKSIENMSTEDGFSATDCSFDSCEISLASDQSVSPQMSRENIPSIFKVNTQAVPTSLNSSSCGFRTYLKGQPRKKFCFYCFDMEFRNCILRHEALPSANQPGIWKTHTTYNSKGLLSCPLLHFFQRAPTDFNVRNYDPTDLTCSQYAAYFHTVPDKSTAFPNNCCRSYERREGRNRWMKMTNYRD
ncbi:unnamed protein product [Auanema sp. JU1783]|nr:unnamed protein product [Auanema sp. JU1783]